MSEQLDAIRTILTSHEEEFRIFRGKLAKQRAVNEALEQHVAELSQAAVEFAHQAQGAIAKQRAVNEALEAWFGNALRDYYEDGREVVAALRDALK